MFNLVLRFIIFIFIFFIQFLVGIGTNNRRYGYRGGSNYNTYYDNTGVYGLSAVIKCTLRRRRALRKCRAFCKKKRNIITIKNAKVILIFDTKYKKINLIDRITENKFATVLWKDQTLSYLDEIDNIFEQTFDDICFSFTKDANYNGILDVLRSNFKVQEANIDQSSTQNIIQEQLKNSENFSLIDINSASVDEIAKLPGINIILAKRIVKYRDKKGGIESKEELFKEFKIKEHFQKDLENKITFSKLKKTIENKIDNNITTTPKENKRNGANERIIDF